VCVCACVIRFFLTAAERVNYGILFIP